MSMLKDLMLENGLTQREVARRLDVQPSVVSEWVKGEFAPHPKRYEDLAKMLGLRGRKQIIEIIRKTSKKHNGQNAM